MRTTALVLLAFLLPAAGAVTGSGPDPRCGEYMTFHCPCHPEHCQGTAKLALGSEADGTFAVRDGQGRPVAYPPARLDRGNAGALDVRLRLYNATPGAAYVFNVSVDATPGLAWTGETTRVVNMTPGQDLTVGFSFRLADVWPDGDYLFPRVVLSAHGNEADGLAAIQVLRSPGPGTVTVSLVVVIGVLAGLALIIGGLAWKAWRPR